MRELIRREAPTPVSFHPTERERSLWSLTSRQVSPSTQQRVDEDGKERSVESEHWGHRGQRAKGHAWGIVEGKVFGMWVRAGAGGPPSRTALPLPHSWRLAQTCSITPQEGTEGLTGLGGWEVMGRSRSEIRVLGVLGGGRRSSREVSPVP